MKRYLVPSKSEKGKKHTVIDLIYKFECDCIANQMGKECRHIKLVKRHLGLSYEPLKEECWYCNTKDFVTEHHLFRKSQGGEKLPTVWLCFKHHELATNNKDFEIKLQQLYGQQNSGKIRNLRSN